MKNIILFFINNIAKAIGTLFGKRFATIFASFFKFFGLANLLTFLKFKRYIDLFASFLSFFATILTRSVIVLRGLVKKNITLLSFIIIILKLITEFLKLNKLPDYLNKILSSLLVVVQIITLTVLVITGLEMLGINTSNPENLKKFSDF
jgi:hypothetical protein